ncbi:MAG: hypothetical protein DGJ47_000634 [Rickettsiaceae bacterium]
MVGKAASFIVGGVSGAAAGVSMGSSITEKLSAKRGLKSRMAAGGGNKLSDLRVQSSAYGEIISKLYGSMQLLVWLIDCTT